MLYSACALCGRSYDTTVHAQNTHGSGVLKEEYHQLQDLLTCAYVHNSGSYFIHSFIYSFKVIMSLHGQEQSLERDSKRLNPSLLCICMHSFLHKTQRRPSALNGRVSKEAVFLFLAVATLLHRHLEVKRHLRESLKDALFFLLCFFRTERPEV
jgi:hypothetical protein